MKTRISNLCFVVCAISLLLNSTAAAVTVSVTASDLDYAFSARRGNSYGGDASGSTVWTAGSQRSENGSADAGNQRAGRMFGDFQLTSELIAAAQYAQGQGDPIYLTFEVNSIGSGVAGTPYTNGLDLRYLGIAAFDRAANTLWNTAPVGGDQSDILATTGSTGSHTVALTNPSVLANIVGATPGQFVAFGFSNSTGVDNSAPVGNSTPETYGFQMNQVVLNYSLTAVIPEPSTCVLGLMALAGLGLYRGRRRRVR